MRKPCIPFLVLLAESSVGGCVAKLQPRSPTFHAHLRVVPLHLSQETFIAPAFVAELLPPVMVERRVDPHSELTDSVDGSMHLLGLLGDPLLMDLRVDELLVVAGLELLEHRVMQMLWNSVECACE